MKLIYFPCFPPVLYNIKTLKSIFTMNREKTIQPLIPLPNHAVAVYWIRRFTSFCSFWSYIYNSPSSSFPSSCFTRSIKLNFIWPHTDTQKWTRGRSIDSLAGFFHACSLQFGNTTGKDHYSQKFIASKDRRQDRARGFSHSRVRCPHRNAGAGCIQKGEDVALIFFLCCSFLSLDRSESKRSEEKGQWIEARLMRTTSLVGLIYPMQSAGWSLFGRE